jgi:L,D-transpeptidase-like protein/putative peptidoglycan binding protein
VRRRVWIVSVSAVVLVVAGAAVAALLAWPGGAIAASSNGLASVTLPSFAGHAQLVSVTAGGKSIPAVLRHGTLWPGKRLAPGKKLTVTVDFHRPGWISWLVGRQEQRTFTVVTPTAHVRERLLRPERGAAVSVSFDRPVSRVAIGGRVRRLPSSRSVVPLGVVASGRTEAGATTVAAAARPWEKLPPAVRVSWFAPGTRTQVVSQPATGVRLRPSSTLTLTFAKPVSTALGSRLPTLDPATPGRWTKVDAHTLEFTPGGFGLPLGGSLKVHVPGRTLVWQVAAGSTLRLQELLARLGYLPVKWRGPGTHTPASELAAAVLPRAGTFSWRYPNTPTSLQALWKPGQWNVVTEGAVMSFEDDHGLATDGVAGPEVWRALLRDDLSGHRRTTGYSYVFVHETIPQSLSLWHNGKVILTSPGNTGIASAPTAQGTWPVFEHIPVGTMSGTNPDGSHYHDPGIQWISYFHGGDALHAFPRASFGTPQSLGCVELPLSAAAEVWPYTPIGTLVTIES